MDTLPLEIIGEIAGKSHAAYYALVRSYPRFARSLTLGDRLDYATRFGYNCRVKMYSGISGIMWYLNGKYHRIGGPAAEYADGTKEWYFEGKLHRIGGPAIETADGHKSWYLDGKLHRIDGPAVEYTNGQKEWYIDGIPQ